jgi:hypothetical protein
MSTYTVFVLAVSVAAMAIYVIFALPEDGHSQFYENGEDIFKWATLVEALTFLVPIAVLFYLTFNI